MRSNRHEKPFQRLRDITDRIKTALSQNEFEALPQMLESHQSIMGRLPEMGDCEEPAMLNMLLEIKTEVGTLIQEIEARKVEVRKQIRVASNKRKLAGAYGG